MKNEEMIDLLQKMDALLKERGLELEASSRKLAKEITSRRQADEFLKESERKFREIAQNLPGVIFQLRMRNDGTNYLAYVSPRAGEIFGAPVDPLDPDWDFLTNIHPEDRPGLLASLSQSIAEHTDWNFQGRIVSLTGEIKWFQGISSSSQVGEELVFDGLMLDITRRKKAEQELEISLIKYKVLFESNPLGITITDKEGNILEANREAERLLGLPMDKHAERTIDGREWKIIRPDGSPMPAEEYASVRALKENRLVGNVEMGIVRPDGTTSWITVTAAPIPLENYGVAITYGEIPAKIL
jgi:PAS domain S-box-containing protein